MGTRTDDNYAMTFLRRLATFLFAILIAAGLIAGDRMSDAYWLALLGAAWLLLLVALWPALPADLPTFARTTVRTGILLTTIFIILGIQLLRIQVVQSEAIANRVGTDPATGEVIANPRLQVADLAIRRGRIFDANGAILADTVFDGNTARRVYPDPSVAHVVGYFSPLLYGKAGLEATYDHVLAGQDGANAIEREINALLGRPAAGLDLRLTLDGTLQRLAHERLAGRAGAVVLIEVETGAVLALASQPGYDPNALFTASVTERDAAVAAWEILVADPAAPLVPRASQGLYTPGSTFKVITAAAVIDAGYAIPDTVYDDDGMLNVDGRLIEERNRPDPSRDRWTLREGVEWSLNVVFAQIGLQLGPTLLWDYAGAFGFEQPVPFDLPVAVSHVASSPAFLESLPAVADTGFGQGELQATPLLMAMTAAGIANQGAIMRPYLVAEITAPEGEVVSRTGPAVWRQAVAPGVAGQVAAMMVSTVEQGLAGAAAIPGVTVGGKTGTAELGDGQEPHAWFIGFAGDPSPRYAVSVVLEHGGAGMAGTMEIGRDLLAAALAP
ncbi:MAG: penicillin-binding protein 2 [Chloroflexia bacterium]|nr:penicillin-binding protein 2 [Chloroflexia bacterium]